MDSESASLQEYLVVKGQEGDRQAINELYKLYAKAMYNICRRMVGDEEEARDVMQDAFVDAFANLGKLQQPRTFPAWMKRVVVNHCINALRKKRLFTISIEEKFDLAYEDDDDNYYATTEAGRILQAMDKISAGCRTVMNLYLFEGYDHAEIGQILGITESASKAQYCKGKAKIRDLLGMEKLKVANQ